MSIKAFTLIEVIISISILLIVLSLAVLTIDMDMFYMDKMADDFVMDVRYVQMECMKTLGNHKITIDIDNALYRVSDGTVIIKTVRFKSRYRITYSNSGPVGFSIDGTPSNAGTFIITDTKTNKTKEISIVPATGRTVIKE